MPSALRILATKYAPGPDGLRQFRVGELVRLISDIAAAHPSGYVVSNDGTAFVVRWDFGGMETTFDLKAEQAAMKRVESNTLSFLSALEVRKAEDNFVAYTLERVRDRCLR
jgi:hypothetical protein